ncbi:DUF366 family protein [Pelotomaculum terephthalicicum JT]|uniref:DUF366 family protein n=1 Tax=Pelotomaculum TaxID=191373 RepID=UPI0009C6C883|nr:MULTISPECIES: DUF366 family protein [Pelotomaculum]MCG9967638.1 DUF366 family protein [Pelotomaculum terephthalicicum JT]OPX84063.1 MAG: hypothetical protein A4E54_03029 [Pelotomaculum sp. PtaB.Bin117]OPY60855.1 MAG: hypothetical protein A4E56_02433 [Pelotomaculum sp. PtaU1.Bin065]
MKELFIKETITYDGTQLSSHWAYRNFGMQGDSVVSFRGPCRVELTEMVDIKDVLSNSPIFSKDMLHFIIEHFDLDLEKTIVRQRLLIAILKDIIIEKSGAALSRSGDDLFFHDRKLTVSIATLTPVSTMIHTGVNVTGEDAPVPAIGLAEIGLKPGEIEAVGKSLCSEYIKEYQQIKMARCKVRGVK